MHSEFFLGRTTHGVETEFGPDRSFPVRPEARNIMLHEHIVRRAVICRDGPRHASFIIYRSRLLYIDEDWPKNETTT